MRVFYDYKPPPPGEQHERLVALRQLVSRGVPCILWGEDALNYIHSVPTSFFDQQILVPDDVLEWASSILQEGRYVPVPFPRRYFDWYGPNTDRSAFPRGILLKHLDDGEPYKLEPLPGYILLLPQSYFGLDVKQKERFSSLVPPLDASNADILAPKYNTCLEGLVHFNVNPPIPLDTPHGKQRGKHEVYIGYLTRYRVKYEDDTPPPKELLPEESAILSELQTEDARWYMSVLLRERRMLPFSEIKAYKRRKGLHSSYSRIARLPTEGSATPFHSDIHRPYSTFCMSTPTGVRKGAPIDASLSLRAVRVRRPFAYTPLGRGIISASSLLARRRLL